MNRAWVMGVMAVCACAAASGKTPRINGPTIYGVRPGSPIIYRLPVTGTRPLALEAKGLPPGVTFDAAKGILGGAATARGTNVIEFSARNGEGTATKPFRLVVGDLIALTPPMGFNTFGGLGGGPMMNEANVRKSFRALVDKGLVDHGYAYCNLDDGWQGERGGVRNALQPNAKFGDMKRLFDEMHAEGLKAGIYSTPWGTSYQYLPGGSSDSPDGKWDGDTSRKTGWRVKKHMFDVQDIGQFAEWGCDYFKYDWAMGEKPHQPGLPHVYYAGRIAAVIAAQPRDIVLELSNAAPFGEAWNFTQLGNMTRTGSDLIDIWSHDSAAKKMKVADWAMGILDTMDKVRRWQPFNRPGHWNMPCPTRVGMLGGWDEKPLAPSRLTKDEQVTHISLWCLWSAPIIIGCPIDLLDDWTLALLTNDEMLDLDQDALGIQAVDKEVAGGRILVKPLENGDVAVGFVNVGDDAPADIAVTWAEAGLSGPCTARDLWQHADLGVFDGAFTAKGVPPHGCRAVRFSRRSEPSQRASARPHAADGHRVAHAASEL